MADILILAGKRPRPGTILANVARFLAAGNATVQTEWRDPIGALAVGKPRLLVHRGLGPEALAALADRSPVRIVNDPHACLRTADRSATMTALLDAGLPVPKAETHKTWDGVYRRAATGPVFVKAISGLEGRGAGVLALSDGAPLEPPFSGPWHVEDTQPGDGLDRKLYVAGDQVFGLLKAWPRRDDIRPAAFAPTDAMIKIARDAGRAVGLEIYGVDLVGKDNAFSIVDVNPFPGFRGVAGAAQAVAAHIAKRGAEC